MSIQPTCIFVPYLYSTFIFMGNAASAAPSFISGEEPQSPSDAPPPGPLHSDVYTRNCTEFSVLTD